MGSVTESPRYNRIGRSYSRTRREDPGFATRIHDALGDARTVVNVGAGTGSYEPRDRQVIAIEPSDVMAEQRPRTLAPAIRATAAELPLRDDSVDAAMAVLTIHHWDSGQERGVREMRRVARDAVVILTYDPEISGRMSLMADSFGGRGAGCRIFPHRPSAGVVARRRDAIECVPDSTRHTRLMLGSSWSQPERVLDEQARNATSGFARMSPAVVDRVVAAVRRDLRTGAWDHRHGHLRRLDAYDVGLRLIISR